MANANKYIIFGAPALGKEEVRAATNVIKSGWIGTGSKSHEFERAVAHYTGARYAAAVNSCTAALHLSLVALGIGKGDEVITTPLTFCASANSIVHSGATPVFVDVERDSMNIDPTKIEKAITKKTKAIMPVHLAGRPCEMDAILKIARKHKLAVIEDAAHALGAEYRGKKIGSLSSDTTCFSFYVTKNVTTAEGGMVTTQDKKIAEHIAVLSLHGMSKDAWRRYGAGGYAHYDVVAAGFKYNLTDIAAAMGLEQMKKITRFDTRRRQIWKQYNDAFKDLPVTLPAAAPRYMKHAHHLYTVLVDKKQAGISRDECMQALHKEGIGTGVHFNPVHLYSYYRKRFGYKKGDFPEAEYIGDRTLSLPFSANLTEVDTKRITHAFKKIILNSAP